jgi:hypothetical protein
MLRLLSTNNPTFILSSVTASFFIHLAYFFSGKIDYSYPLAFNEPISKFIFTNLSETGFLYYPLLMILGSLFQIICAVIINQTINEFKVSTKRAYIAALVFVLVSSLNPEWLILSPQLIVLTLWFMLFYRIMVLSKQDSFYRVLFDIGFIAALASFIYLPSSFFIVFLFPALYSVRPYQFKELLRVIIGLITPLYIILSMYFLNDSLGSIIQDMLNLQNLTLLDVAYFKSNFSPYIYFIGLWMLISLFVFALIPVSLSLKTRNVSTLLIFHTILVILFFFIPTHFHIAYLLLLSPLITIYLSIFFLDYKGSFLPNVIFVLLGIFTLIPLLL